LKVSVQGSKAKRRELRNLREKWFRRSNGLRKMTIALGARGIRSREQIRLKTTA
jgi:ribosomal protein L28